MNVQTKVLSLVPTWLSVFAVALLFTHPTQEEDPTLDSLKQRLHERAQHVAEMRFLLKMVNDTELQTELEIVPDQVAEMKQLVAEFQQSQIQYTMKNGDREQTLNRLINDENVVEATSLENEMFSEFDQTMLSLNKKVEASVLPHQLKRLHQIAKQQVLMNRTPFRDEFGVALAIVAELDTAKKTRNEISKRIATRRRELLDEIEKLRAQARKDVVAAFPKEHRKLIADVYAQYYDVEKNRRASSEAKYENWKIAR